MLVHGTAIAMVGRAVLLVGPSLSGKSDLALRALVGGAALIADDLVKIVMDNGRLTAARPGPAAQQLAVRGIGIVDPSELADSAPLSLCVRLGTIGLSSAGAATSLAPVLAKAGPWHGLFVPQIMLDPFEASAVAKLNLALLRFGH